MKVFLVLCFLFTININSIASEFRCKFVDNNPETVQLNCDILSESHWDDDNCTTTLLEENSRKTDILKVRSIKIGSCQRYIQQDWDAFTKKFKNIEDFDVSLANIDYLPPSFWKLTNMKQINASHNELSRLPIFASAISDIDFSYNNIHEFHISSSLKMPIKSMNLSHNKISSIGRPYEYLAELQSLDLSYNEITTISSYLLDNCPKLKILNLENNQIRTFSVSQVLSGPSTYGLEMLNLEANQLTELDSITSSKFPQLLKLGMKNNMFTCDYLYQFVESNVNGWKELEFIDNLWVQAHSIDFDCQGNALNKSSVAVKRFHNDHVNGGSHQSYYSYNNTTQAPPKTQNSSNSVNSGLTTTTIKTEVSPVTQKTEVFAVQHKEFRRFRCDIYIQNVQHFNIAGHRIDDTAQTIQLLGDQLESMDVSSNYLGSLNDTTLATFTNLQYLNLSHTNLTTIECNAFYHQEKLQTLDLSYNELSWWKFNTTSNSFSQLETLNLEGNRLTEIDDVNPSNMPKLMTLGIAKNRFSCQYLVKFLNQWQNVKLSGPQSFDNMNVRGIECNCVSQ